MAEDLKHYRVFIASPGGLADEREAFRKSIENFNTVHGLGRRVLFSPVGWENTLGGVGRPQSLINDEIRRCDFFVLMLWDRWGSSPNGPGVAGYSSATEEEYRVAWECLADGAASMRQIVALFKAVEPRRLQDPGPQLQAVLDFKTGLEREIVVVRDFRCDYRV